MLVFPAFGSWRKENHSFQATLSCKPRHLLGVHKDQSFSQHFRKHKRKEKKKEIPTMKFCGGLNDVWVFPVLIDRLGLGGPRSPVRVLSLDASEFSDRHARLYVGIKW